MILVTLGTQKFQMNRLIEAVDKIAPTLDEEVFIQTGNSTYIPKNCKYSSFVEKEKFQNMIAECSLLITHSGVGSIMTGVKLNKPVIVVPRLSRFKEHVDDHQLQIAEAFEEKKIVLACKNIDELAEYIRSAAEYEFERYTAPKGRIEDIILDFIESNV